jgi:uncharacterized iron-regulated protein
LRKLFARDTSSDARVVNFARRTATYNELVTWRASLVAIVVLVAAVAALAAGEEAWRSPLGRAHPLTGRIWEPATGRFVERGVLVERLGRTRFVLLGEKHDNPDHHRLQADVLRALIAGGRRPAVGFEMFGVDDADAIARHLATAPADAAGLADVVGWKQSGWPDWAMYRPIVEAALSVGLPVVATNLSRAANRNLRSGGLAALEPETVIALGLGRALPPPLEADLAAEIRATHCGHASDAMVARMTATQRARDAQMAAALASAAGHDGAVLIAGAGHVRNDRGVPMYVKARLPGASVETVAFLEVSDGQTDPVAYGTRFERGRFPFDYVWFTPRVDDRDPCEAFAKPFDARPSP